jgi:hypothetical protein
LLDGEGLAGTFSERFDRPLVGVGADNPVTAADLVALCRMKTFELGIWLREALAFRHCQYP